MQPIADSIQKAISQIWLSHTLQTIKLGVQILMLLDNHFETVGCLDWGS